MIEARYGDARVNPAQLDALGEPPRTSETTSEIAPEGIESRNPAGTFPTSAEATQSL